MADIVSWSPIDDNNNAPPPDGWPEGQMPSTVNNAARAMMGAIRRNYDQVISGTLALPYLPLAGGVVTGDVQVNGAGGLSLGATQLRNISSGLDVYNASSGRVASHGPGAGFFFGDRDLTSPDWDWAALAGVAYLQRSGVPTIAVNTVGDLIVYGNYIHFINATSGPLIYADDNNHAYKLGTGDGAFLFQNHAGTNVASITSGGVLSLASTLNAANINVTAAISASTVTVSGAAPNAAYNFHDRDGISNPWAWYAQSGVAHLWNGTNGERVAVYGDGTLITTGEIHAAGSLYSGFNLFLATQYIFFNGNTSATQGPYLAVDNTNWISRVGSGNGSWFFEKNDGTVVATIDNAGSFHGASNLFLSGTFILFNGNTAVANGPLLEVNNTNWGFRLGSGAGRWYFQNSAGTALASIDAAGHIYSPVLRGGAADAGVVMGLPPTPHALAFGWDSGNSKLFHNVDGAGTNLIPWSPSIESFVLATNGGAPSGWALEAISGGTVYNLYIDYATSDARVKRGIADSEVDALAALCALPVRRFEWRDEVQATFGVPQGPVEIGLVAQDLLPHMPDCVGISQGRGEPFPEDTHSIMHDRIDAYTIRAIQQLAARIVALEGGG